MGSIDQNSEQWLQTGPGVPGEEPLNAPAEPPSVREGARQRKLQPLPSACHQADPTGSRDPCDEEEEGNSPVHTAKLRRAARRSRRANKLSPEQNAHTMCFTNILANP